MVTDSVITDLNALFVELKNEARQGASYFLQCAWTPQMNFASTQIHAVRNKLVLCLEVFHICQSLLPAWVVIIWDTQDITRNTNTCHLLFHSLVDVVHGIALKLQREGLARNRGDGNWSFVNHHEIKIMSEFVYGTN